MTTNPTPDPTKPAADIAVEARADQLMTEIISFAQACQKDPLAQCGVPYKQLQGALRAALARPQEVAGVTEEDAAETLKLVCDVFGIGSAARTRSTILANVENAKRRADCLWAIERAYFRAGAKWALSQPMAAIPEGMALVPIEPTLDMSIAFAEQFYIKVRCIDDDDISDWWTAMLEAAREFSNEKISVLNASQPPAGQQITAAPQGVSVPPGFALLAKIGAAIAAQDNRATDAPIFIVQQKRSYVTEEGYNESRYEWRETESGDYSGPADDAELERLEKFFSNEGHEPKGWRRFAVMDVWEFVTACFTEQGCKDFIAINGHNLKEPRIYAQGSYRNEEFRSIRKALIDLAAAPPLPPGRGMVPMTNEQIESLWQSHLRTSWQTTLISPTVFARAIEAHHGIKEGS